MFDLSEVRHLMSRLAFRFKLCLHVINKVYRIVRSGAPWRSEVRSILLGAAPRSGKSTLSHRLENNVFDLDFDRFNSFVYFGYKEEDRNAIYCRLLGLFLAMFPRGLCIEGSGLIYGTNSPLFCRNRSGIGYTSTLQLRSDLNDEQRDAMLRRACFPAGVKMVMEVAHARGAPVFFLVSHDTAEQKAAAMAAYRKAFQCWTSDLISEDGLSLLGSQSVITSQLLSDGTIVDPSALLMVGSRSFDSDISSSVARILSVASMKNK